MQQENFIDEEIQDEEEERREQKEVHEFAKEIKEKVEETNKQNKEQQDQQKVNVNSTVGPIRVKFDVLRCFFDRMSKVRGKKKSELLDVLTQFFFKPPRIPEHTYIIMRLIIPFQDRDRGVYKLQEKNLAKLFRSALGLSDDDYHRMANYKQASMQPYGAPVGDFPMVVHNVIKDYCRKDSIITISEVDSLLDNLVKAQDTKEQELVIVDLIKVCTADEILWIIRIILKDLKIGLKYEKLLQLFHKDAPEYYNATSSLKEVCKEFVDQNHTLKNVLRIFHAIKPMLAAKKSPEEIRKLIEGKELLVETKFDGERIQCHFTPEVIRFFTRNSNDYTYLYKDKLGDIVRQSVQAQCAILDGEIIVVNKETGDNVRFGLNKTVALSKDVNDDAFGLCYKIFDILYLKTYQGQEVNTMSAPLATRRSLLQRIIVPIPNQLEVVQAATIKSFEELIQQFDMAIERNQEGIIIKQMDSQYLPNERSTKWVKMKGDYVENMTDNCDLLVIGGYFGTQSHRVETFDEFDRITHFLMGLAQKIDKNQPTNSVILPFVKVGTGFTDNELSTIRNKLRNHWIKKQKPNYIPQNWNPGVNDRPDVYINNPAHSIIFEVKAAEITKSNTFPTDYTLRFPRCYKTRMDKDWYEMMTMQDLSSMINDSQYTKNLKKKNDKEDNDKQTDDEVENEDRPIRQAKQRKQPLKKGGAHSKQITIMTEYQGLDPRNITKESNLFVGCEFFIVNLEEDYNKQYLESIVLAQGGTCIQNYIVESVTHVVASIIDFRVNSIIEKFPTTIIRPQWIIECIRRSQLVNIAPRFILFAPLAIMNEVNKFYDRFGDSYFELIDDLALKDICDNMKINETVNQDDLLSLEEELLYQLPKLWIFQHKSFYPYCLNHQISDVELETFKARIIARGGSFVNSIYDEKLDFIILFKNQTFIQNERLKQFFNEKPYIKTTTYTQMMQLIEEQHQMILPS
ncbi:unnamed protein product [Paramecium octaurelia]|uniref:DNA ligase n=1 Tax=Paramecium octaurelia TaxID=43137 RepID=A0A8S1V624_PAROT|nr:unnamed protein product [Paramecium octaurelia]